MSSRTSWTNLTPIIAMCTVTATENLDLIKPITEEEIQRALFQMNPYKAPGSDGFGALFFQKFWPLFKDRLCLAIQHFFCTGELLKQFNHTFIALIPKVDNPNVPSHFRPISLYNTLYKIIALKLWSTECGLFWNNWYN